MNEVKREIAKEALKALAGHYKTTTAKVSEAIVAGNTKLVKELNAICEETLNELYKEVA